MRIATQSQVTTKVNAIKDALNSFSYTHKCIYYYRNSSIDSSWSTNVTLPNDGKQYRFLLCYTFSAKALQANSSYNKAGMIIDLTINLSTQRVIQGFSSACSNFYGAGKNNISTGLFSSGTYTGEGQSIPVSITLTKVNNSTLQGEEGSSGFQLAVIEVPETILYERL